MKNVTLDEFFEQEIETCPYNIESETSVISFLEQCCQNYYTEGKVPLISDSEYDKLFDYAKEKWPENQFFSDNNVGYISTTEKKKVKHEYILGSLTKYKNENILDWLNQYDDFDQIIILPKFDGLSVFAEYNQGKLVKATTRGNGVVGIDITEKVRVIRPTINYKEHVKLRGEILLQGDSYKQLGFANKRNGASGLIGLKNIDKEKLQHLTIIFYELIEPEIELIDSLKILDTAFSFEVVEALKNYSFDNIFEIQKNAYNTIDLDGLVLINSQNYKRENVYHPSNKVCWKPATESVIAEIETIEWSTTRTGRVVPVAIFKEAVELSGSMVQRATCYNAKYVIDNKLETGTKVEICKSNYIIPKILKVLN